MKALIPTIAILLFLGGCTASLRPMWSIAEIFHIRDVHTDVPEYFPVLSLSTNDNSAFIISRWKDRESAKFVTNLDDHQVDEINKQLLSTVTDTPSKYKIKYFKIVKRTDSYVDVSLEVPTLHESHTRGWYRIQDNAIAPQRFLSYGPGFAFIVMPLTVLAGICCSVVFRICVVIYNKRKTTEPAA
jgi:hypothetical protein